MFLLKKTKHVWDACQKAAEDTGYDAQKIYEALSFALSRIKPLLSRNDYPRVYIKNLGTFHPTSKRIERQIRNTIRSYQDGRITREFAFEKLETFFKVRRRLKWEERNYNTDPVTLRKYRPRNEQGTKVEYVKRNKSSD